MDGSIDGLMDGWMVGWLDSWLVGGGWFRACGLGGAHKTDLFEPLHHGTALLLVPAKSNPLQSDCRALTSSATYIRGVQVSGLLVSDIQVGRIL